MCFIRSNFDSSIQFNAIFFVKFSEKVRIKSYIKKTNNLFIMTLICTAFSLKCYYYEMYQSISLVRNKNVFFTHTLFSADLRNYLNIEMGCAIKNIDNDLSMRSKEHFY